MSDAIRDADAFCEAAQLNRSDPLLDGSLLRFPDYGQLVMTGDLHGHRRNLERVQKFCDLQYAGARHVILHEIIHEEVPTLDGRDTSFVPMLTAAKWKCAFPDQVHFLQANHELAQLNGHEITKAGRVVTMGFADAVCEEYGQSGGRVLDAIYDFIASFPLAGRTPSRILLSHSLPSPRDLPRFDPAVLTRSPTQEDLSERGSAHVMVWGRYHTEATLATLRDLLDVDYFICGHQPQETGYGLVHSRMIILASDHNLGTFLPIDLGKPATLDSLVAAIRPLAAIG